MVSLNDRSQRGAFFLGSEHDRSSRDTTPLSVTEQTALFADGVSPKFSKLNTKWLAICETTVLVVYEVSLFVCAHFSQPKWPPSDKSYPFQFFTMLHGIIWFCIFISGRFKQYLHQKSRQRGYLSFYRKTRCIRRIPVYTISLGSVIILILISIIGTPSKDKPSSFIEIRYIYLLGIFTSLELLIVLPALIVYIVRVEKWNRREPHPDVEEEPFETKFEGKDFGTRSGEYIDDVLEKQADMIRYLQQHNANLGQRILQLTQQAAH